MSYMSTAEKQSTSVLKDNSTFIISTNKNIRTLNCRTFCGAKTQNLFYLQHFVMPLHSFLLYLQQ